MCTQGLPRNLGGPVASTDTGEGLRATSGKALARGWGAAIRWERTTGGAEVVAVAEGQPKAPMTGGRKSEWPILPSKRGKPPQATLWREGATE